MKRILILVEGLTEETFVREVLAAYFESRDAFITPTVVKTKRIPGKPDRSGGGRDYSKIRHDIQLLLGDTNAALVTTMFDFYRLPSNFPGRTTIPDGSCYERVQVLERAFSQDIDHQRFLPYLALHEFEALLFASVDDMLQVYPGHKVGAKLNTIRQEFSSPEEINNDFPPSKRILDLIPEYEKTFHGPLITLSIGIDLIREQCSHFNEWISKIEQQIR